MDKYNRLKVIFRKNRDGDIIAFFPEVSANYGNIMSYSLIDGHGEANYLYYMCDTFCVEPDEYEHLLKWLIALYDDCDLEVRRRLRYDDLINKAWKR